MGVFQRFYKPAERGWLYSGWRLCGDLDTDDMKDVPRYFRCVRCYRLVTHGQVKTGGCACGNRRLNPARVLTYWESLLLKLGWFPVSPIEREFIRPLFPWLAHALRARLVYPR